MTEQNLPTKKILCKYCGAIFEVRADAIDVTCPNCQKEFKIPYLGLVGGKWA